MKFTTNLHNKTLKQHKSPNKRQKQMPGRRDYANGFNKV